MALNSFQLFFSQVQSAPEVLKTRVLQIMFDMLMVHEADFLGARATIGVRLSSSLLDGSSHASARRGLERTRR